MRDEVGIHQVAPEFRRAVFLDRDGVLNRPNVRDGRPFPPDGVEQLVVYDEAPAALAELKTAGFLLLVVTNQPDVARGTKLAAEVAAIDGALAAALPLDGFYVCTHDGDGCDCRKPKPGLILRAALEHYVDLERSFMVGDRWRDVEAGQNAGVQTILIDRHYAERGPARPPDATVSSVAEAARFILEESHATSIPG